MKRRLSTRRGLRVGTRWGGLMGAGHDHAHGATSSTARALLLTLALTASYTLAEVVGGVLTGSLGLLADAGHMHSDTGTIAVALVAIWLAHRRATPARSFGFKRAETLAALHNGVTRRDLDLDLRRGDPALL